MLPVHVRAQWETLASSGNPLEKVCGAGSQVSVGCLRRNQSLMAEKKIPVLQTGGGCVEELEFRHERVCLCSRSHRQKPGIRLLTNVTLSQEAAICGRNTVGKPARRPLATLQVSARGV
jgi:hypothetical protein